MSCSIYDLETKEEDDSLCFNKIEISAGDRTSNYYAKENSGDEEGWWQCKCHEWVEANKGKPKRVFIR